MLIDPELVLEGATVRLEPLRPEHADPLLALARRDPDAYRHTSTPVTEAQRDAYVAKAFRERAEGRTVPLAVYHRTAGADAALAGTTRYTDLDDEHRVGEIGYTWYRTDLFGTGVNVQCKYLMLRHAFEDAGLHRIQLHTDQRNERSQRAIEALGARYEGVLRRHKRRKDGSVRDTVVYAVTDLDWPEVRDRLAERVQRHGVPLDYRASRAEGVSAPRAGSPPGPADRG